MSSEFLARLRRRSVRGDAGITLTELIVAMFVGSIVLSGVAALTISTQKSVSQAMARAGATADVRTALAYMSRRLRVAVPPGGGTAGAFEAAGPRSVTFYASLVAPGSTGTPAPTKIEFYVDTAAGCLVEARTAAVGAGAPYTWPSSGRRTTCIALGSINPAGQRLFTFYATPGATTPLATDASGAVTARDLPAIESVAVDLAVAPTKPAGTAPSQARTRLTLTNLL
ncbi:PulJ/GspJ family protein [Motilibacter aurantiacus]|uniref:PulJ/GspJ family protein n=1 Tax=Motilibacter aurantiacus TaxID=2714955 RepID=UPI00140A6E99|nr:prepilin-type N-terminal cleavage/methylation domain-containing protein [Motilibacter aurantiacus]NHC46015.1 hypothetical protein [Motilibacter aurantiacus]